MTYKLIFSVRNPLEALKVGSELRQQIWTTFEENDITIPFPKGQKYPWSGVRRTTKHSGRNSPDKTTEAPYQPFRNREDVIQKQHME